VGSLTAPVAVVFVVVVVIELPSGGGSDLGGVCISPAKVGTARTDTNSTATANFLTSFIDLLLRFVVKAVRVCATKLDNRLFMIISVNQEACKVPYLYLKLEF
jgi:hypothetical protein